MEQEALMLPQGAVTEPLLSWYDREHRILPWRSDPQPYYVLLSELMLQQTRVAAALPYFKRFIAALPDIKSLADASEEQVMKLWEGLGYYSRARNLHKAAKIIAYELQGQIPSHYESLLKLPGIGEYTAGAVASIAFGRAVAAVDGNVMRVFLRLCGSDRDVTEPSAKVAVRMLSQELLPPDRAGDYNQALMELGAIICTPKSPKCESCPLKTACRGYALGIAETLPVRPPKAPRPVTEITVLLFKAEDCILLHKREEGGLLGGLWELPHILEATDPIEAAKRLGIPASAIQNVKQLPVKKHIFTHLEWKMYGYLCDSIRFAAPLGCVWSDLNELAEKYAVAGAFQKLLKCL